MPPFPVDIRGQTFQGYTESPFQTPGGAFGRSVVRSNVPGASFFADRPQAPSMAGWPGMFMKVLSALPWAGSLFSGANAAGGQQEMLDRQNRIARGLGMAGDVSSTQGGYLAQPESALSRAWTTVGAGLKWAPGGQVTDALRAGYNVVQGVRGAGDFASRNFPDMAAGLGGMAAGSMIPSSSPNSNWSPAMSERAFTSPSWMDTGFAGADNMALQGPRDFEQERMG